MDKTRGYNKMSEKTKNDFAFRTIVLRESGVQVARELGLNYFTAKNMITLYKKTGKFSKEKAEKQKPILEIENPNNSDDLKRLDINCGDEGQLFASFAPNLTPNEECYIWQMYYLMEQGVPLYLYNNPNHHQNYMLN